MPRKRGGETGGEGAAGGPLPPQPAPADALIPPDLDARLTAAGAPPAHNADGTPNLERLKWEFKQPADLAVGVSCGAAEMPKGFNFSQAMDLLEKRAKYVYGIDPKNLMDVRSDAEKVADALRTLATDPEKVLEEREPVLLATLAEMEREMDSADAYGKELLGGANGEESQERQFARVMETKKKWAGIIRRVLILRKRAREPFPGGFRGDYRCYAAMHPLRFMIYVGRSSIGADSTVFRIGKHHAEMASVLWQARSGLSWVDLEWHNWPMDGAMFIISPGHGKTALMAHAITLSLDQNPREKWLFGHAQAKKAEENLAYVASNFDASTANGRRNLSLFSMPRVAKLNKNEMDFEDRSGETKRGLTIQAYGVTAKISGSDADGIWFDDPCDQELAEQETTRNRVFDRLNGTWRPRKRGKKTFEIISTTLWHHDDPNARWFKLLADGTIKFLGLKRGCGGPDEHFKPLWEAVYPASRLKEIYAQMRNPRLYAAAYQGNPQPEELRKIRRLAFYDPTEESHAEFMAAAVMYLSVDPAATNSEKADHASFLYAAVGDVTSRNPDGSTTYVRRMRIVDAQVFHATQGEAVDKMVDFSETRKVDYALWETRSAFAAGPEMLRREFGIDVIEIDPKNKKKELRLNQASPLIDDALRDKGLPPPAVEFPGTKDANGELVPDPDLTWFYDQILNFGVCQEDHAVDALTQLVNHCGRDLGIGEGVITTQVRKLDPTSERVRAWRDRMFKRLRTPGESAAEQDCRWAREALEN